MPSPTYVFHQLLCCSQTRAHQLALSVVSETGHETHQGDDPVQIASMSAFMLLFAYECALLDSLLFASIQGTLLVVDGHHGS